MLYEKSKKMKVSESSQRKLLLKNVKLEEKVKELQEKNKVQSKLIKYYIRRIKALTKSRDNWKSKNADKSKKMKRLAKQIKLQGKVKRHHFPLYIITLCIQLRIQAGCSYRGICKILQVLKLNYLLEIQKIPCANTIENWVSKTGHYCIENASESLDCKTFCLIMDECINLGNERTLLMLLTPYQRQKEKALTFEDTRICYLAGKASWTGEKIKKEVEKIMEQKGIAIKMLLSDEDSKLLKTARLLNLPHLADVNHAIATCLRKTFEKEESYQALVKQISAYQAKSVNQKLSYLRPPKQRVKARFMNQKGFVKWGAIMLERFDELNEKEKAFFSELPEHQALLKLLGKCIELAEKIAIPLKTKGLSTKTIKQAEQRLFQEWFLAMNFMPITEPIKSSGFLGTQPDTSISAMMKRCEDQKDLFSQFLKHLKTYIDRYKEFMITNKGVFNVSSDIIESLFGKYKRIKASNPLVGVSKIDLELPVYSIPSNQIAAMAKTGLEATFMSDLRDFVDTHSSDNQANRRAEFFKNRT